MVDGLRLIGCLTGRYREQARSHIVRAVDVGASLLAMASALTPQILCRIACMPATR